MYLLKWFPFFFIKTYSIILFKSKYPPSTIKEYEITFFAYFLLTSVPVLQFLYILFLHNKATTTATLTTKNVQDNKTKLKKKIKIKTKTKMQK